MKDQILDDPDLGPIARNVATLWYLGMWNQLPAAWRNKHGAWANDVTFVVSPQSYTEGLVWKAIHTHPPAAKQPGYGSWALPPVTTGDASREREPRNYDAIIVGGGPIGAHVAKELVAQQKPVLMLEAGRAGGLTYQGYRSYVDTYYTRVVKDTNSPYPYNASAPSPNDTDILKIVKGTPDIVGYQVEMGPEAFGSTYLRQLGGTSLHWLGTTPRFCPNDFQMQTKYGVGVDWPLTYADLEPYYCEAEWSIGVSANKDDQEQHGIGSPRDTTIRWSASRRATATRSSGRREGAEGQLLGEGLSDRASPASPRRATRSRGRATRRSARWAIPTSASAARATRRASRSVRCRRSTARSRRSPSSSIALLHADRAGGRDEGDARRERPRQRRRVPALRDGGRAAPTSRSPRRRRSTSSPATRWRTRSCSSRRTSANKDNNQVGHNLMDHPFSYTWALAPQSMGSFRGPIQTSGIETLRDGAFRRDFAAFRTDVGNAGLGHRQLSAERRRRRRAREERLREEAAQPARHDAAAADPHRLRHRAAARSAKNSRHDQPRVQGRARVLPSGPQLRRQRLHVAGDGRGDEGLHGDVRRARNPEEDQQFLTGTNPERRRREALHRPGRQDVPTQLHRRGASHRHAPHGHDEDQQRREPRPAQLGPRQSLRRRLRQLPDDGDGQPHAHGGRPGAASTKDMLTQLR